MVGSGIKESVRRRPGCELAKFLSYIGRGWGAREFCRGLFFILFYFAFLRSIHRNAPIDGLDAVNDNFVPPLLLRQSVAGLSHGGWLPPSWPRSIRRLAAERSVSGAARCRLALSKREFVDIQTKICASFSSWSSIIFQIKKPQSHVIDGPQKPDTVIASINMMIYLRESWLSSLLA